VEYYTFRLLSRGEDTSLQLLNGGATLLDSRPLDMVGVERLVQEVERAYEFEEIVKVDLVGLGRRLYDWLDGPLCWLKKVREDSPDGLTLHIDVSERLRHLPWELLYRDAFLCAHATQPFTPVSRAADVKRESRCANRPLRILFMACSPEGVDRVLDFEQEEGRILQATRRWPIELVVEESGSLSELQRRLLSYGRNYFDVVHLTGHAGVYEEGPRFVTEDRFGQPHFARVDDIGAALSRHWPGLVFLSGCSTSRAPNKGVLPSLCEGLVRAGAPAVLGWALPVGDEAASIAAAHLYEFLAEGMRLDESVARARQKLIQDEVPFWHLLRLYSDATPLTPMVTPLKTSGRERITVREAQKEFLDAGCKIEICPREQFVGRRRPLQRCLRVLERWEGDADHAEGVLLYGAGGLGKSSLAARLCDRLEYYLRVVVEGPVDEPEFLFRAGEVFDPPAMEVINSRNLKLEQRLRLLLKGPLATSPVLFVFDDFECNVDIGREETQATRHPHQVEPKALGVLQALLAAIRKTHSESRVIVTSRYSFEVPGPATLHEESLESLRGPDLDKKCRQLARLRQDADTESKTTERVLELGAGNPRLLERLNRVLAYRGADDETITSLEHEAERFRVDHHGVALRQEPACRHLVARAAIYNLPVPLEALEAICGGEGFEAHLQQAVSLGLVERGRNATGGQEHYYVSPIVGSLVEQELDPQSRRSALVQGADYLYWIWYLCEKHRTETRLLEVFRLATKAGEVKLAQDVADVLACDWVQSHRYHEVPRLFYQTPKAEDDYRLLHYLGRAQRMLGDIASAGRQYERALEFCPKSEGQTGFGNTKALQSRSAIMHDMAGLLSQQGDLDQAEEMYLESLEIDERTGDLSGQAATLHTLGSLLARVGDIEAAERRYRESLRIRIRHEGRGCRGQAATMHALAGLLAQQGKVDRARKIYGEVLRLHDFNGDTGGRAATLHQVAGLLAQQGEVDRALALYQESLDIKEGTGDARGRAITLHQMANLKVRRGKTQEAEELFGDVLNLVEKTRYLRGRTLAFLGQAELCVQRGDLQRAEQLYRESSSIQDQIRDAGGRAVTKYGLAGLSALRGETNQALEKYEEALEIYRRTKDVRGQGATMRALAGLRAQRGEIESAEQLSRESLQLSDRTGCTEDRAASLRLEACLLARQGDVDQAAELLQESRGVYERLGYARERAATIHDLAIIFARRGEVGHAEGLYREALKISDQIDHPQGRAAALHQMAGLAAQRGDLEKAEEMYSESLLIMDQVGDAGGRAATLHQMAGLLAQRGDLEKAEEMYSESLRMADRIGDEGGRAATLHQMAYLQDCRGDVNRALELYRESLEIKNRINDVEGQAATLHQIAYLHARRGETERALGLYRKSLKLADQVGDVEGTGATLAQMASLCSRGTDVDEARWLYQESTTCFATARAWPRLATVLGNLGVLGGAGCLSHLAQAVWLSLRTVGLLADSKMAIFMTLVARLGQDHPATPLIVRGVLWMLNKHPGAEEVISWITQYAGSTGMPEPPLADLLSRFQSQGLGDPAKLLPALERELEALVGDAWLFDRSLVGPAGPCTPESPGA